MPLKQVVMATAFIALGAFAVARPDAARADSYVIGVENIEYLPHYASVGEETFGFARDLLDAFAKDSGHRFRYQTYPVIRLNHALAGGRIDFKYPASPHWTQVGDVQVHYSDPIADYMDGLNVLPDRVGKPVRSIALVRGFTPQAYLDAAASNSIEISEHATLRDVVNHVLRGRSDAAYADRHVIRYFLSELMRKPDALVFDSSAAYVQDSYRLATIKHRAVLTDLNLWLAKNGDLVRDLRKDYGLE